jgi:NADH-quinone oxidoreductase subunit E
MPQSVPVRVELTPELEKFVDVWKDRPGSLVMILHKVQEEYRYIPRDVALTLSEKIGVPLAKIYGVITFYHLFKLEKPGKHIIAFCMGTACYLNGGEDILKEIENMLGTGINSVTEDGQFSIQVVRCLGCCGLAPVMTIDGEVYGKVTKDKIPEILAKYKDK